MYILNKTTNPNHTWWLGAPFLAWASSLIGLHFQGKRNSTNSCLLYSICIQLPRPSPFSPLVCRLAANRWQCTLDDPARLVVLQSRSRVQDGEKDGQLPV